MEITAALAADLRVLSEALDAADLGEALRQLAADARLAVPSYLGLTVVASTAGEPLILTALEPFVEPGDVVSSLVLPVTDAGTDGAQPLVVILYAGRSGAFVDLAADLSWLTGRALTEFPLDAHLHVPADAGADGAVQASSRINQAIGVLIGRGYTPEEAEVELDGRAAATGHTRAQAADLVLTDLDPGGADPIPEG